MNTYESYEVTVDKIQTMMMRMMIVMMMMVMMAIMMSMMMIMMMVIMIMTTTMMMTMLMVMVDDNDSVLQWRCFSFVDTKSVTVSIARTDAFTCDINRRS
jgi:hypothetical protein